MKKAPNPTPVPGEDIIGEKAGSLSCGEGIVSFGHQAGLNPVRGTDNTRIGKQPEQELFYRGQLWIKRYRARSRWSWLDLEPSEVAALCVLGMALCAFLALVWSLFR